MTTDWENPFGRHEAPGQAPSQEHEMKRALRLVAAAALVWCLATQAQAQSVIVRVYNPNWSYLNAIEHGQMKTVLSQSMAIPDSTLGPLLSAQVAAEADKFDASGHVSCTGDCPDYDWQVDASGSFAFTEPSNTTLTVLSATQNRVKVDIRSSGKVLLHVYGEAIGGGIAPDADGTIDIEIPITVVASAEIAVFPDWAVENVQIHTTISSKANISGYTGELFAAAAVSGSLIGGSPLGLALGGPGTFFSLIMVAGEVAIDKIEDKIAEAVVAAASKGAKKFTDKVLARISPTIGQGNDLKNQAMNTVIPGVGRSLTQLQSSLGARLHVRTRKSGANVQVTATVRFDGRSQQGTLRGEIRFPKNFCTEGSTDSFGGGDITYSGGLEPANGDLNVGQPCAQLLGGGRWGHGKISGSAFLGLNPPQENLPEWNAFSRSFGGVGTLRDTGRWYACDFQATGYPNGVLELSVGGSLGKRLNSGDTQRVLVVGNQVFDERLALQPEGVIFGGAVGGCEGIGGKVGAFQRPKQMKVPRRVQPDDMRLRPGHGQVTPPDRPVAPSTEQSRPGQMETPAVPAPQKARQVQGLRGHGTSIPKMPAQEETNGH